MRLVLDTNTALSGLIWQGTPGKVIDAALVRCVAPIELTEPTCRDPDDDQVLAATISGDADLNMSGDDDLLSLDNYRGIGILSAKNALTMLEGSQN